jgi:hypothetical protein
MLALNQSFEIIFGQCLIDVAFCSTCVEWDRKLVALVVVVVL